MNPRPLFLLSLPRSGSTLAQRILASHPDIATTAEPWLALPHVYALRERGMAADYGHVPAARALRDFAASLPNGEEEYWSEVRRFLLRLYGRAAHEDAKYFLDKTPRYHLITEDLFRLFPDEKYLVLWRNPLSVVASISETWAQGRWNLARWNVDLFLGLDNLIDTYRKHRSRVHAINYERLVAEPLAAWPPIFEHLGLSFDPSLLTDFTSVQLAGRMGDSTGTTEYRGISSIPIDNWKTSLRSPVRKRWCRNYLRWIGDERLTLMGYDLRRLLEELDSVPSDPRRIPDDLASVAHGLAANIGRRGAARVLWGRGTV